MVYVGLHDINQPVYSEQQIVAERIFTHEQYNTDTQENDIAIIRLSKPVTISDKINVICLPGAEALNANETVWISKSRLSISLLQGKQPCLFVSFSRLGYNIISRTNKSSFETNNVAYNAQSLWKDLQ